MADNLPMDATFDEIGAAVHANLAMMTKGEIPAFPLTEPVTDVKPPKVFNDNLTKEERQAAIKRSLYAK